MSALNKKEMELRSVRRKLKDARSALQIMQTWSTFRYGDLPAGHALVPEHVRALCVKTLERTKE